ncbi:hypothetical protein BLNAU_17834 [Blattamonas nauphoetae]|uniref:Uncharacterized protein n=1 Tax=Blattamonas nauphoetae TaxID=2049346 RepID=A0ABQ9XAG0_9EUKA|nr:hypothetical protein BLNAU_17834 [Blattamonas nauphoetae]
MILQSRLNPQKNGMNPAEANKKGDVQFLNPSGSHRRDIRNTSPVSLKTLSASLYLPLIVCYSFRIIISAIHDTLLIDRDFTKLFIIVLNRFIKIHFDSQPTVPSLIRLVLGTITFLTTICLILLFSSLPEKTEMLIKYDGGNVLLDICEKTFNKESIDPTLYIIQNATASLTFRVMLKAQ